ncbi:hypothetical protein MMC27_004673 [Xylographa pallens]|nr:hypothetical protein [Xylographa pallens]
MADPVTIFTVGAAAAGLVLQLAAVAQQLYSLSQKIKKAEFPSIRSDFSWSLRHSMIQPPEMRNAIATLYDTSKSAVERMIELLPSRYMDVDTSRFLKSVFPTIILVAAYTGHMETVKVLVNEVDRMYAEECDSTRSIQNPSLGGHTLITSMLSERGLSMRRLSDYHDQPTHKADNVSDIFHTAEGAAAIQERTDSSTTRYPAFVRPHEVDLELRESGACLAAVSGHQLSGIQIAVAAAVHSYITNPHIYFVRHQPSTRQFLELADNEGYTLLQRVCESNLDIWAYQVRLLLLNGANATVGASWKTSPLGLATEHRNANVMSILLNQGAGFCAFDGQGAKPLLFRIVQGRGRKGRRPYCSVDSCALKILLTHGGDASAKDASGNEDCIS